VTTSRTRLRTILVIRVSSFLRISRASHASTGGNLKEFHERLRAKVDEHETKHPWCHLNDIKAIKDDYEHPDRPTPQSETHLPSIHTSKSSMSRNYPRAKADVSAATTRSTRLVCSFLANEVVSAALRTARCTARRRTSVARSASRSSALQNEALQDAASTGPSSQMMKTSKTSALDPSLHLQSQILQTL
jgi:hypothetical protein